MAHLTFQMGKLSPSRTQFSHLCSGSVHIWGEIVPSLCTNVAQSSATLGWGSEGCRGSCSVPCAPWGCALCSLALSYAKSPRLGLPRKLNQALPGLLGALWLPPPRSHHITWSTCLLCSVSWANGFSF